MPPYTIDSLSNTTSYYHGTSAKKGLRKIIDQPTQDRLSSKMDRYSYNGSGNECRTILKGWIVLQNTP